MTKGKPIIFTFREKSPCKECAERSIACSDHCPKDARGEYGYNAWKKDAANVNDNRKEYNDKKWRRYHG